MIKKILTKIKCESIFHSFLAAFICLLFISCSVKYPIISVSKLNEMKKKKPIPHKQYIILQKSIENLDPSESDEILNTFYLIFNKQFNEAEKHIQLLSNTNSDENIIHFCNGLLNFFSENYSLAYQDLNNSEIENYNYLKYLLIGDCMLEMNNKPLNKNFSKREILFQFQKAMDSCGVEEIKDIIKIHIKFAKYGGL